MAEQFPSAQAGLNGLGQVDDPASGLSKSIYKNRFEPNDIPRGGSAAALSIGTVVNKPESEVRMYIWTLLPIPWWFVAYGFGVNRKMLQGSRL